MPFIRMMAVPGAVIATLGLAGAAAAQVEGLTITAPAAPGGGWDQTARVMQSIMQETGAASSVDVMNVPGAGGTVGLAQLVSAHSGQGDQLLVGGLVMLGAILTNDAPVTLDQVTPIARLTGEYEVIVVPADSEFQTFQDLLDAFQADPGAVAWAGGSAGGTDHILVGLIANEIGVGPADVNYIPYSGGGEATAALLANDVAAGVSGINEFIGQIEAGELRALAISSPERLEGLDIPTLIESGVDVELVNWRGVLAAPDISDEDRQALLDAVDTMATSDAWAEALAERNWMDVYLAGDEFAAFIEEDRTRVEQVLRDIGLIQ